MIKQFKKNPDYWISDSGSVYRIVKLKPQQNHKGYLRVKIFDAKNKQRKNMFVHRLVAEVFKKDFKPYKQVNHLDKNIKNNNLDNLEVVTMLENIEHRDSNKDLPF